MKTLRINWRQVLQGVGAAHEDPDLGGVDG